MTTYHIADDCKTAAEVRARIERVKAFRREMHRKRPPHHQPAPPPVAPPPRPAQVAPPAPPPVLAKPPLLIKTIATAVADHFGTTVAAFIARDHRDIPTMRRRIALFMVWELSGRSYPFIGRFFERDHTTILHAVRIVKSLLKAGDEDTMEAVTAVAAKLGRSISWDDEPQKAA